MNQLARLQQLFDQLADLDPVARVTVLDRECVDAPELRAELEALLASDEALAQHTARKAVGQLDAMLLDAQPESLVGAQVGHYTLIKPIGAGGMGAVYLAERNDGVVQQRVAIKFLARDLLAEGFRQRFELERHVLAQLDHPSITRLIDAEELADGTPYYVMDYVEGVPITRYASDHHLDLRARLSLMIEVAKAVAHAHQALIVHRDLKPGNILVDAQGQPKLLDFGIAKPLAAQLGGQVISQTITGQRFFSPQHAAPEQLLGEPITVGCDIYGLGTLLYELLTGEPALSLTGLSAADAETKILHQMPDPPSQRVGRREQARAGGKSNDEGAQTSTTDASANGKTARTAQLPDIPARSLRGELDAIVLNCLRKRASERYRSVDDLINDLQAFLDGRPVQARGGHGWYRARKFIARHRWAVTAAGLTVLALIGSSVLTYLQSREAQAQRDAARLALEDAEQQRDRAQRVTQFLIDAFAAANPGGEMGKNVTARDILERSAKQLETDLQDQPELKAQLLATIADGQKALGLIQESAETAARAVELVAGTNSEAERVARLALAAAYTRDRNIPAARAELDIVDRLSTSPLQRVQWLLAEQALMGRLADFDRSHTLYEQVVAEGVLQHATVSAELAWRVRLEHIMTLQMLKRREEALALAKEVYRYAADSANPEFQILAAFRLVSTLRILAHHDEAIQLASDTVEQSRTLYGETHSKYGDSLTVLSNALKSAGRGSETVELSRMALTIAESLHGKGSPTLLSLRYNLARSLVQSGELGEGIDLLTELSHSSSKDLPDDSPSHQLYAISLAEALLVSGQHERALNVVDAAVTDGRRHSDSSVMSGYLQRLEELRINSSTTSPGDQK